MKSKNQPKANEPIISDLPTEYISAYFRERNKDLKKNLRAMFRLKKLMDLVMIIQKNKLKF